MDNKAVVFYTTPEGPYMHTCFHIGKGEVNVADAMRTRDGNRARASLMLPRSRSQCHNNNRCGAPVALYPFSSILSPP